MMDKHARGGNCVGVGLMGVVINSILGLFCGIIFKKRN
jgi:hypothetical protein